MAITHNSNKSTLPVAEQTFLTPASTRDVFIAWLSAGNAKKFSPQAAATCVDKISEYVINKKISCSIWEISKLSVYKSVYQKVLDVKLLRIMEKNTYKDFTVVGQLYAKFLKEKPWEKVSETTLGASFAGETEEVKSPISKKDTVDTLLPSDINTNDVIAWLITQPDTNETSFIENNDKPEMLEPESLLSVAAKTDNQPLTAYEPQQVDFSHPEFCTGCDPASCIVEGNDFGGGNWRDILVALSEAFLQSKPVVTELYHTSIYPNGKHEFLFKDKPKFSARQLSNGYWVNVNLSIKDLVFTIGKLCEFCGVDLNDVNITYVPKQSAGGIQSMNIIKDNSARFVQQTVRESFRTWIITHNPEWSSGTVMMHYSDAYYLYNNKRGITLEEALTTADGMQRAYDAIEHFYIDNPTQTNNPSGSARGYLRSLRMLKEFLDEKYPELFSANLAAVFAPSVPEAVVVALNKNYASGFRFDTTYVNLLSSASGEEVDEHMQSALKRIMFHRDDDIYFLLDIVADATTRKGITDFADSYLQEYGCFEIPEFYKLYEEKVNPICIRNADDFESFYEQISKSGVRCVQAPHIGNRIVRYSNGSVWSTFKEVATKIVSVISEEYYGSCNEDDLHTKFYAFSTDLLGKIIKQYAAAELIRVEINDSVCYQTFDALGLPENFSEVLAEALECLSDIGLDPTQDVLHTTLSLKIGVNFRAEYNLPDWDTYRRLIAAFYKAEPRREWKYNIFREVSN